MPFVIINKPNPDSASIANKEVIDLSISTFDVSASGHSGSVVTNYSNTAQTVIIGSLNPTGSTYYTPIYKEKLDYTVWATRINKNFQELD
jgi:hypothetical protein